MISIPDGVVALVYDNFAPWRDKEYVEYMTQTYLDDHGGVFRTEPNPPDWNQYDNAWQPEWDGFEDYVITIATNDFAMVETDFYLDSDLNQHVVAEGYGFYIGLSVYAEQVAVWLLPIAGKEQSFLKQTKEKFEQVFTEGITHYKD